MYCNLQMLRRHLLISSLLISLLLRLIFFRHTKRKFFFRSAKDKDKGLQATQAEHKKGIGVPELFFLLNFLFSSFSYICGRFQLWQARSSKLKSKTPKKYFIAHHTGIYLLFLPRECG